MGQNGIEDKMDLPYHLPKPGFKTKNNVDNIYIYNDQMYRKKGNETWLERETFLNTNPSDDDIVEVSENSHEGQRVLLAIFVKATLSVAGSCRRVPTIATIAKVRRGTVPLRAAVAPRSEGRHDGRLP